MFRLWAQELYGNGIVHVFAQHGHMLLDEYFYFQLWKSNGDH